MEYFFQPTPLATTLATIREIRTTLDTIQEIRTTPATTRGIHTTLATILEIRTTLATILDTTLATTLVILGPILVTTQEAGSTRVVGIAKDLTLVVGIWLKAHGMNGSARATTLAPTLAACNITVTGSPATMSFVEK